MLYCKDYQSQDHVLTIGYESFSVWRSSHLWDNVWNHDAKSKRCPCSQEFLLVSCQDWEVSKMLPMLRFRCLGSWCYLYLTVKPSSSSVAISFSSMVFLPVSLLIALAWSETTYISSLPYTLRFSIVIIWFMCHTLTVSVTVVKARRSRIAVKLAKSTIKKSKKSFDK